MLDDREDDVTEAYEREEHARLMAGLNGAFGRLSQNAASFEGEKRDMPKTYAETDEQREEYGLGAYPRRGDGWLTMFPDHTDQRQQFQGVEHVLGSPKTAADSLYAAPLANALFR